MIMESLGVKPQRLTKIERISPRTRSVISVLHSNPAFTQAVRITAGHDLIVIGSQNDVDSSGRVVSDDLARRHGRRSAICGSAWGGEGRP
jgi:hypothetical protein